MFLHNILTLQVKDPQPSILTSCVKDVFFFAEAADSVDVPFEVCLERSNWVIGFGDVDDFYCVVHAYDDFIFFLGYF